MLAGLIAGTARPLRAESTTAAATALVVLLTGYADDGSMLLARLADTFVGIGVGLVVNLAVWPPLRDRRAARRIDDLDDRIGALLRELAAELGEHPGEAPDPERWVERTRALDHGIDDAWVDVRSARESGKLNFRREAARRVRDARDLGDVLLGIEQAVAETRSMVRTMSRAGAPRTVAGAVPRRLAAGCSPAWRGRSAGRGRAGAAPRQARARDAGGRPLGARPAERAEARAGRAGREPPQHRRGDDARGGGPARARPHA